MEPAYDRAAIKATVLRAHDEWKRSDDERRARLELGRALIEARKAFPSRGPKAKGWGEFLDSIGIPQQRASDWMRYAGLAEVSPSGGETLRSQRAVLRPPTAAAEDEPEDEPEEDEPEDDEHAPQVASASNITDVVDMIEGVVPGFTEALRKLARHGAAATRKNVLDRLAEIVKEVT